MLVHRAQRPGVGVGGHISTMRARHRVRSRFQPLLPGPEPPGRRRPDLLLPGPRLPPGMYARAYLEGRLTEHQLDGFRQELYPTRRRPAVLPAPAAHAGLLGNSRPFPWARRPECDLPSPVQPLPAPPRHQRHVAAARVVIPCDDGEMDEPETLGRDRQSAGARGTGQPDLRHQRATCSGSTVRCVATAR